MGTGGLLAQGGSSGTAETGNWVYNNTAFILYDSTAHTTLATLTATVQ